MPPPHSLCGEVLSVGPHRSETGATRLLCSSAKYDGIGVREAGDKEGVVVADGCFSADVAADCTGQPEVVAFRAVDRLGQPFHTTVQQEYPLTLAIVSRRVGSVWIDRAVKPAIDKIHPLSEFTEAMRHLNEGHARGKVVISVGE